MTGAGATASRTGGAVLLDRAIGYALGAIEVAVHAWDVARACGQCRPIPHDLAADLLTICPLLVPAGARDPQFAARVTVPPSASPSDRLVAYLGREPAQR